MVTQPLEILSFEEYLMILNAHTIINRKKNRTNKFVFSIIQVFKGIFLMDIKISISIENYGKL